MNVRDDQDHRSHTVGDAAVLVTVVVTVGVEVIMHEQALDTSAAGESLIHAGTATALSSIASAQCATSRLFLAGPAASVHIATSVVVADTIEVELGPTVVTTVVVLRLVAVADTVTVVADGVTVVEVVCVAVLM